MYYETIEKRRDGAGAGGTGSSFLARVLWVEAMLQTFAFMFLECTIIS